MKQVINDEGSILTPKQRHWKKKYDAASLIPCACGCGETLKEFDQYGRAARYVNGHNRRKYQEPDPTRWLAQKRYRIGNPEKVRIAKRDYYRMRKLKAMALLGNICQHCGTAYDGTNAPIFEFHHSEPVDKEIGITRILINWAWDRVIREMKKCVLICANCHNKHHGGEW